MTIKANQTAKITPIKHKRKHKVQQEEFIARGIKDTTNANVRNIYK